MELIPGLGPLQTKWVLELESDKHKQGEGNLRDGDAYCCLGVACEFVLGIKPEKALHPQEDTLYAFEGCTIYMPATGVKQLGLSSIFGNPYTKANTNNKYALAALNDHGKTFKEIAQILRDNPKDYFKEEL